MNPLKRLTRAEYTHTMRDLFGVDFDFTGLLPPDQAREMRALWDEFEAKTSPEAQFAGALDRLMPLLHNFHGEGRVWRENGVVAAQVHALNERAFAGAGRLREFVHELIDEAVERGYLAQCRT